MKYISPVPQQGALYHRLQHLIVSSYSGLGPNNVATRANQAMIGKSYQQPLSGSTTMPSTVLAHPYR